MPVPVPVPVLVPVLVPVPFRFRSGAGRCLVVDWRANNTRQVCSSCVWALAAWATWNLYRRLFAGRLDEPEGAA